MCWLRSKDQKDNTQTNTFHRLGNNVVFTLESSFNLKLPVFFRHSGGGVGGDSKGVRPNLHHTSVQVLLFQHSQEGYDKPLGHRGELMIVLFLQRSLLASLVYKEENKHVDAPSAPLHCCFHGAQEATDPLKN